MNTTTTTAKVAANVSLFPAITVVGTRALEADQSWFQGEGRGYVREFIVTTGQRFCVACDTTHDLNQFPTFSVPRQNGATRSNVCRPATKVRRQAAAVKRARQAATAPARAALAAKVAARKAAAAV